ncbi:MAG: sigma-70 family RNA polymerase sigma factor [Acidobacteriota bacterium]|nr:sigma-70 family RNA polymerase sigma factor [Acidobacteriota bacterium]
MEQSAFRSDDEPDARLIARILGGEADLYGEIMRRYQRLVASVIYKMGISVDDMEDLVSEVFMKAYRNLARYRPENAFSTWIYRIATNRALDEIRSRRHRRRFGPLDERLPAPGPGAESAVNKKDRSAVVARALEQLPHEYRAPLVLLHMEDRKVSEIADLLGIPEGTVKTRLARGRVKLRRIIARQFPEYAV